MCKITSTELKRNLSYYLDLSSKEDVLVTKNDKVISVLTNPFDKGFYEFMKLEGCMAGLQEKNVDDLLAEEIGKRCGF